MTYRTPEQMGISSKHVLSFYKELDYWHLSTHAVILSRGNEVFSECYYAPFHADFLHRMYSTTKSFVSVAIGFCEQDGLLSLDDPLCKFFPEYKDSEYFYTTSIRDMLQMRTAKDASGGTGWFGARTDDRVGYYFSNPPLKNAGSLFYYDSTGSFMLGAVVEKLTGKPFIEYLKDKALREIGFSEQAHCLQCPGGHSWGDSGLLCTARDLWLFARFVLNGGTWNGKRYLNEAYLKAATAATVPTNPYGFGDLHDLQGYGYQFWGAPRGCFATLGMGNQVSFCDPAHDFIMVINSDNQGNTNAYEQIFGALYRNLLDHLEDHPLPEDPAAKAELDAYLATRKLFTLYESPSSPLAESVAGKVFCCEENPMGIQWFRLDFKGDEGSFTYENAQGEKCMRFGFGHNVFEKFPEEGYSDLVGSVYCPGNYYDAAFSADWPSENTLRVRVQIIDKYFGNLSMLFGFSDENTVSLRMEKKAEDFLTTYRGIANAKAK